VSYYGLALGPMLVVLCVAAATAVAFDRDQDNISGTWDAVVLQQWTVPSKTKISITLEEDGTMFAGAGCNFLNAKFSVTGKAFSEMEDLITTAKLCDETITVAEEKLSEALLASREWRVENGSLVSRDEDGRVVARFRRHKND